MKNDFSKAKIGQPLWDKPEFLFQPDPIQKISKEFNVYVNYLNDNSFQISRRKDKFTHIPAKITFEIEK